jgi:hypothetical protein
MVMVMVSLFRLGVGAVVVMGRVVVMVASLFRLGVGVVVVMGAVLVVAGGMVMMMVIPLMMLASHKMTIRTCPAPGGDDPQMGEPGAGPHDRVDLHLHVRGAQEGRNGPKGFRIHQAGVQEGRREHVPGDAGEAVEIEGAHGHPWVGAVATDSITGAAAASAENLL